MWPGGRRPSIATRAERGRGGRLAACRERAGLRGARLPMLAAAVVIVSALLAAGSAPQSGGRSLRHPADVSVPALDIQAFSTTAYCTGRITRSGARVHRGMAAADPRVLPLGTVIRVDGQGRAYDGIYTVMDTGAEVRGRELDLYLDDCAEADEFGRRQMRVAIIRRGWDPKSTPER
jgi:3D (Asp-Asp-Asp) domain-containing protein